MGIRFTIFSPPRTKKNSQQIILIGGHPRIIPSKAYRQYERDCSRYMPKLEKPIDYPVNVEAIFFMPKRRRVDLVNLQEALCDVLVHYKILADDNSSIVASMDGSRVLYDKHDPRTEVYIKAVEI